jgi:hypothetical protein
VLGLLLAGHHAARRANTLCWAQELGRREQRNVFASVIARLEKAYVVRARALSAHGHRLLMWSAQHVSK